MEPFPFLGAFLVVYLITFVFRDQVLISLRKVLVFSGLRQASAEEYLQLRGWRKVPWGNDYGFSRPGDEFVYATSVAMAFEGKCKHK
jgi:hypothetical protein